MKKAATIPAIRQPEDWRVHRFVTAFDVSFNSGCEKRFRSGQHNVMFGLIQAFSLVRQTAQRLSVHLRFN